MMMATLWPAVSTLAQAAAPTTMTDRLYESLGLMVVGMLVVFLSLAALMALITLVNKFGSASPTAAPSAPAAQPGQGDRRLLAVLTAAATMAVQHPVQIRSVRPVDEPEGPRRP